MKKLGAALNLPSPLEEGRHNKRDKELLPTVQSFSSKSMLKAVEEAITATRSADFMLATMAPGRPMASGTSMMLQR